MALRGKALLPSTVSKVLVCVDSFDGLEYRGRLFSPFWPEPVPFASVSRFLGILDSFFDEIAYPQAYYEPRSFVGGRENARQKPQKEVTRYMSDKIFEEQQGKKATFIIQVQYRQNATWQGTISWTDKKVDRTFRSTLELIKLMSEAVEENDTQGIAGTYTSWQEDAGE